MLTANGLFLFDPAAVTWRIGFNFKAWLNDFGFLIWRPRRVPSLLLRLN